MTTEIPEKCTWCSNLLHVETATYLKHRNCWACGPCMIEFMQWFHGHSRRRWHGIRFYDHAGPVPEAVP